jgi:hypothetical protein
VGVKPVVEWQRGLQYFNGCFFLPNSVDGTGAWDKWDPGDGTITHATVGTAFDTQFKRTIYTNDATHNRALGPRKANAGDYQFWLGDKRFCGGFYFSTVFRLEGWNDAGRLFVGLTAGANANCISDTLQNNSMGFFHKSTDGANIINFVTRDNAGTELTQVVADATHAVGVLATGVTLLWEIWHFPNGIDPAAAGITAMPVNWKLSLFDTANGTDSVPKPLNRVKKQTYNEISFSSRTTTITTMFAPQVQMSNAADGTVGRFSIGAANVYCAPWSGEMD